MSFVFDENVLPFVNQQNPLPEEFSAIDNAVPEELPDGSIQFHVVNDEREGENEGSSSRDDTFYDNLAKKLEPNLLSSLAGKLLEDIQNDKESRSGWEKTANLGLKYCGFTVEEFRNVPFMRACGAFDTTLSTALIQAYSVARAELFPAKGPCRYEICGASTPELEDIGERVELFLNWYLTKKDKDYYPDSERLLIYTILFGCSFRKVWQDSIQKRPMSRLIRPQDFIINHHTVSILSSTRLTEVLYLTRREIILNQQSGDFVKDSIPDINDEIDDEQSSVTKNIKRIEGVSTANTENKSLFQFYECHVELSETDINPSLEEEDEDIPKPYVITICVNSKKVVSIKRNWKEDDEDFKRKECYVVYQYFPGFGIYSNGLAHLLGSNAITLTSIQRQLMDAGTLKNFPGGFKSRQLRSENNDVALGPASFQEVETGGTPIADHIFLMPYGEPSQVLMALRAELKEETQQIAGTAELGLENVGQTPVGTMMSQLEVKARTQSSVLRSFHVSLSNEFELLYDLFGEYLPNEPYPFSVPGKDTAIMRDDFNDKINITPVSDPDALTATQRIMKAEAKLQLAQSSPDIHNMREAFKDMYQAIGVEDIDALLPPEEEPKGYDPVTENMLMLLGKPFITEMFQDDDAHIISHKKFIQDVQSLSQLPPTEASPNVPMIVAQMNLHVQQHEANKLLKQKLQMAMQEPQDDIPPEEILHLPDIQNELARKAAHEAIQQMTEEAEAQQAAAQQPTAITVAMEDVAQRREQSEREAEVAHMKVEAEKEISHEKVEMESFKAQLKFEGDKAKIAAQRDIAEEKAAVDSLKNNCKPSE